MTREDFLRNIKKEYGIVKLLSAKNGGKTLVLKHNTLGKKIVLRLYRETIPLYDYLKSIKHKNLPLVFDTVPLSDGEAVFEEYIEGPTVAEVIENGGFTYRGAKRVVCALCEALGPLHKKSFVHRDIKPENVIVTKDGTVKLIDFNASREVKPENRKDTVAIGTIGFASPEQLGLSQTDGRADIYAIGVLLNVMLTGAHPSQKTAKGKAAKIIKKCTAINPKDRYQTVEELKREM
ncbi:MAG: serine/threonine protein kinase [Clostridia bacterium]|nr:serine/threonine protein kinase [Clostridia bacterium]